MKLIVDAMGGDHAPEEIVLGAVMGKEALSDCTLIFTGREQEIKAVLDRNALRGAGIEIVHAESVVKMEDDPLCVLKTKKDSSMARGFALLRDGEGDAFLSAGSTGALIIGASSRIYRNRLPQVRRCAIATVLPLAQPLLLLDSGANVTVTAEELCQFAAMGKAYAEKVLGIPDPRIGLVNNGAEETKGTPLYVETHRLLREQKELRFVGNVEARDIPFGVCDVLVCDGFTGNVILKLVEGAGSFFTKELKAMMLDGFSSKIGALLLKKKVMAFKEKLSYEKYGAAPLLGTYKPVLKAHGSSKRSAVQSAVVNAAGVIRADLGAVLEESIW